LISAAFSTVKEVMLAEINIITAKVV
jgi:hypothetical protein